MATIRAIAVLLLLLLTLIWSSVCGDTAAAVSANHSDLVQHATANNSIDRNIAATTPSSPLLLQKHQLVPETFVKTAGDSSDIITIQSSASDFFSDNYNRIQTPLSWQRTISGGVLLGFGLLLVLFGFLHRRFSLLLTGFIGGGIAAYAILHSAEPDSLWDNRILIYVAVCIAAGLLIGLVLLALNKFATWILGGAGGLALGVYVLSWRQGGLIHNTVGRIALMAGAAALGIVLSLFLGGLTIVFATVLIGAYMFTLGLDMFLRTGFLENYKDLFRTGSAVPYQMYSGIYGMLGVLSLAFLVGCLVQIPLYFYLRRRRQARARAAAVPSAAEPYGPYDGYNNRGSQYGSRDQLNPSYNAPAEYTWWGKRKNKDAHLRHSYNGGYSEKDYDHGSYPNQNRSSQLNQYQGQHIGQTVDRGNMPEASAAGVGAATAIGAGAGPKTEIDAAHPAYQEPASTSADKTVVFEEKKDWFGRTKVVPRLTDPSASMTGTHVVDTVGSTSNDVPAGASSTMPVQ